MFNYFDYITNISTRNAVWLYTAILVVSFIFASLSQGKNVIVSHKTGEITTERKFNYFWFIITFLFLWFFYALNQVGTDYTNYLRIYEESTFNIFTDKNLEKGYLILNAIIKLFVPNPYIGVSIIKSLTLIFIFLGLYNLRYKININIALLAYVALFYFWSFNVIRISLASAICFWGLRFYLQRKYIKYFIIIIISGLIHFSAFSLLFLLLITIIMNRIKMDKDLKYLILIISVIVIAVSGTALIRFLSNIIPFFQRYFGYIENIQSSDIGFGLILFHGVPLIFIIMLNNIFNSKHDNYKNASFVFFCCGLGINILAYMISILGRMATHFSFPIMISMPYYLYNLKTRNNLKESNKSKYFSYQLSLGICIGYFILRFIMYIGSMLYADGIEAFMFIWQ